MQNNIPLPTDNIFKFYALFGLLLFIFAVGSLLYVSGSTNNLVLSSYVETETIKSIEKPMPGDTAKLEALEKRVDIAVKNKNFYSKALGGVAGIGIWLVIYGFHKWHTMIQPIQDQTAKLQLEKLQIEIESLKKQKVSGTAKHSVTVENEEELCS